MKPVILTQRAMVQRIARSETIMSMSLVSGIPSATPVTLNFMERVPIVIRTLKTMKVSVRRLT